MFSDASKRAETAGWIALAAVAAALTITPITNNDIFLHLTTGRLVLQTWTVPAIDDYSALARGRPFMAHEWLSGVLFHLVERFFGLNGVLLFKTLVTVALAFLLYAAARALGARPPVTLAIVAGVLILAAARIMERPHIFTFVMSASFLLLLHRRYAGRQAALWVFLPLQCLWANLHGGGSVIGPFLLGLAALGRIVDALAVRFSLAESSDGERMGAPRGHLSEAVKLVLLALGLVAVSALNPRGVALLRFPFELTGSSFMQNIYEWQPPFGSGFQNTYTFRYYLVWAGFGIAVLSASLGIVIRCRDWPPGGGFPYLLFAAFFVLSLQMNRNVTDFALVTAPSIAAIASWLRLPHRGSRFQAIPTMVVTALLIGLAGWFVRNGYAFGPGSRREFGLGIGPNIPVAAADYLERNAIAGNAYDTYGFGAYLIYRLYPTIRVVMDSRNDVYGEKLYSEYMRSASDAEALRAMLERADASVIVIDWRERVPWTAPLLAKLPNWKLVYFDDRSVVCLRDEGPYAQLIQRDAFHSLDPVRYRAGSLSPANPEGALAEAERAVKESGGASIARLMKIEALARLGRLDEASAEERLLVAAVSSGYGSYLAVGQILLATGHREEAAARYERALALEPDSRIAREGLQSARRGSASAPALPAVEAETK